jgi:hypothetical protein
VARVMRERARSGVTAEDAVIFIGACTQPRGNRIVAGIRELANRCSWWEYGACVGKGIENWRVCAFGLTELY